MVNEFAVKPRNPAIGRLANRGITTSALGLGFIMVSMPSINNSRRGQSAGTNLMANPGVPLTDYFPPLGLEFSSSYDVGGLVASCSTIPGCWPG